MNLYCVDNHDTPTPVTLERIGQQVSRLGATLEISDGAGLAQINNVPFQFHFASGGKFLSIRAIWETGLEPQVQYAAHLSTAADHWNREKYFPTIYLVVEEQAEQIEAVADFIVEISNGLDDAQLLENISAAVATGVDALQFMAHVVSTVKAL